MTGRLIIPVDECVSSLRAILLRELPDPFKIQQYVRDLISGVVYHITQRDGDSLATLAGLYTQGTTLYGALMLTLCEVEHYLRGTLASLDVRDEVVSADLTYEGDRLIVHYRTAEEAKQDLYRTQYGLEAYIEECRREGEPIPSEIDRLLRSYRSLKPITLR